MSIREQVQDTYNRVERECRKYQETDLGLMIPTVKMVDAMVELVRAARLADVERVRKPISEQATVDMALIGVRHALDAIEAELRG